MNTVTEIRLESGIGRVWESRPGQWSWAHPDGSQGSGEDSFESAMESLQVTEAGI